MALVASISPRCICRLSRQNCLASAISASTILHLHRYPITKSVAPTVVTRLNSTATTPIESSMPVPSRQMWGLRVLKPALCTVANFSKLRKKYSYFDKTRFIPLLCEEDEAALIYCPRRFGKSLTVSMLEHFHGFRHRARYKELFGELAVDAAVKAGKIEPGCYVTTDFDFSVQECQHPGERQRKPRYAPKQYH